MIAGLINNRYQILQTLGRGGFGETFLAIDTHMPSGRKCVLKQLKPVIQQPNIPEWMQERFKREAAILEKLGEGHSQIPKLYAYFSEGQDFYLVQEFIEGTTIAAKVARGILPETEVQQILVKILPVLDYIHSYQIVHRDIKPENIILRHSDGLPILIDFGAVKEAMTTSIQNSGNSAYSIAIGTPGYMSSEQAAGRPIYASDIYALGLTAIYMLTGKSPQQLNTDPTTAEINWREYLGDRHSHLAMVIDRSIRFHPRDRFSSAREMLYALQFQRSFSQSNAHTVNTNNYHPVKQPVNTENANTVVVAPESLPNNNTNTAGSNVLLYMFLSAAIAVSAFAIAFNYFFQSKTPISKDNNPPVTEITPTPDASVFPTPETTPTPEATVEPTPEATVEPTPEATVEPTPEATATPETTPTPETTVEPTPETTLTVPIFKVGTTQIEIVQTLGNPTSQKNGYWPNTDSWLYRDVVPNNVDLGYIFDKDTQKLRQSEASFATQVNLETIQTTLKGLIGGDLTPEIEEALDRVYQRKTTNNSFAIDNLKGTISRTPKDRIYIAIWEADLH
jgi:serine/threonine-protein kinase